MGSLRDTEAMASDALGWVPIEVDGIRLLQQHGLFDVGSPERAGTGSQFKKVVGFWAPRRWLTSQTMDVQGLVEEIEDIVRRKGFITCDGQVITSLDRAGPWEATFEAASIDVPLEVPKRREWDRDQRTFFGVAEPYQMADDEGPFTSSCVSTVIVDSYLSPGEMIAGLVHGARERGLFTCPCHYASVTYTTRHRLVCMMCGSTHVVLRQPLLSTFRQTVTAEEWAELFDLAGSRHHEPLDLAIVDVANVENSSFIWATDQWVEALGAFKLACRSTQEDYDRAVRGALIDASILREQGWTRVLEPPPPAFQIMDGSIEIDLLDNAARALADGVSAYLAAYVLPSLLADAVKNLFQAIELLLKARLEESNPLALRDHPNNPAVLTRLAEEGLTLSRAESDTIAQLRKLRNELQHSSARFNHRATLALCRSSIIFIDRFAAEEMDRWIGDVAGADDWYKLLKIDEVRAGASRIAETRLAKYDNDPAASITECPKCSEESMLRPFEDAGACCVLCKYIPVNRE